MRADKYDSVDTFESTCQKKKKSHQVLLIKQSEALLEMSVDDQ